MISYITAGIILGFAFITIYILIHRRTIHDKPIFDIVYRSFMYAAGIILGACTVYYSITKNYPLGLTEENLRLPITIGGSMLIVGSFVSQIRLFKS